jgi:hypothetical protein
MIAVLFYCIIIGSFRSLSIIHPFVLVAIGSLVAAGFLMSKDKWWGCFGGVAVGIFLIYMGLQETGQIIKEWPLGIILCAYYIVCGIFIFIRHTTKITE